MGPAKTTNGKATAGNDIDRAALAGMLSGYGPEKLVDEVITAWEELASANKELANSNQRNRHTTGRTNGTENKHFSSGERIL